MSEAVSTFTTGNVSLTLADEIKKYKTDALIKFLQREEDLELDDDNLKVIREEKECKERKKRSFTSYKTQKDLKEVLAKYGIDGNGIGAIHQFPPKTYTLEDNDEELKQCIREIKRRLGNMGTILADSNEAMQFDYAIKALEELICITEGKLYQVVIGESVLQVNKNKRRRKLGDAFRDDFDYIYGIVTTAMDWYFILYASDGIYCTSKNPLNIRFTESALIENLEDKKELCKNVKRVIEGY
ncbi:hypothetical protein RhiirA1_466359 [Rhizophagus irregularis]|uniref:Crinkler family protein n=1 Tax=Rhizophagus irregularis TaxID=588596 RepID=A0A2N0RE38_9GLOM|nr:hypothetical protein RhiirA1_466359 [Rhizophagus irregularis]